jgi:hypothetical protein
MLTILAVLAGLTVLCSGTGGGHIVVMIHGKGKKKNRDDQDQQSGKGSFHMTCLVTNTGKIPAIWYKYKRENTHFLFQAPISLNGPRPNKNLAGPVFRSFSPSCLTGGHFQPFGNSLPPVGDNKLLFALKQHL